MWKAIYINCTEKGKRGRVMVANLGNRVFYSVCDVVPERDNIGKVKEYSPQARYHNRSNLDLHDYGHGSFCKFRIPKSYAGKTGVYVLLVDGLPKYVGECEDLAFRFNTGYGNIAPRNCFKGGRPTNCRINKLILEAFKEGRKIMLLFHETSDRFKVENELIEDIRPEWNRTKGKHIAGNDGRSRKDRVSNYNPSQMQHRSRYQKLAEYLRNSIKQEEVLTYYDVERIIGTKLPLSAYKHRAWWSNGSHSQAEAWLGSGWKVKSVEIGQLVIFLKKQSRLQEV